MRMSEIAFISGNSNKALSERICKLLGVEPVQTSVIRFKNDNLFCQIKRNIRHHDVFILQSGSPPVNDHVMELFLLIDAAKYASADRITAVLPYFPYVRSDKKDQPRISIAARLIADLVQAAGADRILTMDLHSDQITGFFRLKNDQLYGSKVILEYLSERKLDNHVLVAPDVGALRRIRYFASKLDLPVAIIEKKRTDNKDGSQILGIIGQVKDSHCIVVDDEISTGGSMVNTCNALTNHGAKSVIVAAIHGVFADNSIDRMKKAGIEEIITTDTICQKDESGVTVLSVSGLLAEGIKRIHDGESISSLFE